MYQSLSHSQWECKYHVGFTPKRRRKVLYGELRKHLVGWQKVELAAGEKRVLTIKLDALPMSVWSESGKRWTRPSGVYRVEAGPSSAELPLKGEFSVR